MRRSLLCGRKISTNSSADAGTKASEAKTDPPESSPDPATAGPWTEHEEEDQMEGTHKPGDRPITASSYLSPPPEDPQSEKSRPGDDD